MNKEEYKEKRRQLPLYLWEKETYILTDNRYNSNIMEDTDLFIWYLRIDILYFHLKDDDWLVKFNSWNAIQDLNDLILFIEKYKKWIKT